MSDLDNPNFILSADEKWQRVVDKQDARIKALETALTKIKRTHWKAYKDPVSEIVTLADDALKG